MSLFLLALFSLPARAQTIAVAPPHGEGEDPTGDGILNDGIPIGELAEYGGPIEPGVEPVTDQRAKYAVYNQTLLTAAEEPVTERGVLAASTPESVEVEAESETPFPAEGSPAWVPVLGRVLIIAGLVLVIPPIIQAVQTGNCALDDRIHHCDTVDPVGTDKLIGSLVGGVMITTGIITLAVEF